VAVLRKKAPMGGLDRRVEKTEKFLADYRSGLTKLEDFKSENLEQASEEQVEKEKEEGEEKEKEKVREKKEKKKTFFAQAEKKRLEAPFVFADLESSEILDIKSFSLSSFFFLTFKKRPLIFSLFYLFFFLKKEILCCERFSLPSTALKE
jgi:hypothetical protein